LHFQPTYRIHLADPLGLVDTPFIVTTAYTTATGLPRAEWFLVVPESKCLLFSQRNKLDHLTFPESRIKFDEELLLSSALDQAILRLRRYITENKGSKAMLLLAKHTRVQPADFDHLVKLWMRGSCCGNLSEIRAKSECSALTDLLVWIHGLPMFTNSEP
jgi:hypothetical protein